MKSFDLGKDNVRKIVLMLAFPAMLGQFVNVLYGIIDRMYIGNISDIGQIALGSVGICAPVTTLLTSVSYLIGVGGAPLLAMSLGEQNKARAKQILSNSFMALLVISLVVVLIALAFIDPLLGLFGATSANFDYAKTYLSIYLIGAPFSILALGLNQFIICQGFSKIGMKTMLIGAIFNIILDPLFIFVFKLDVAGAAIATVISQIISCMYAVLFLFGKRTFVKIGFSGYSIRLLGKIMLMGLSPFIILATDSIVYISLNSAISKYSGNNADFYLGVATIATSFFQLITMPLVGISGGTQAVLSYNYGAKNLDRVKESEKQIVYLGLAFTIICFLLSFVIARPFASLFSQDPNTQVETVKMIRILMFGIIPLTFQYCFVDGMTALAAPIPAASCSLFRKLIVISATWLLPLAFGTVGCFYAEVLSDYVGAIISSIVFIIVFPRLLKKREEKWKD